MADPSSKLSSQETPSSEDPAETVRKEIKARRKRLAEKYHLLKTRVEVEEAKLDELFKEYDTTRSPPDGALARRIVGTRGLINSVKRNLKDAIDSFNAGYDLETLGMTLASITEVERRFLAAEVGLTGIERETQDRKPGLEEGPGEIMVVDTVPEHRLFRMDVGEMDTEEDGLRDDVVFFEK